MNIKLNGEDFEFSGKNVADLVVSVGPDKPFAVAVNTQFVSKGVYEQTLLSENDAVDIVRPVVGG
ncbi:sulfur carrier protein ThiS [Neisseria iguanae]|uniref:Thiamine biosynthesis protein ThiS n=1 Tax=Neisseria iguanae TaxID=90242 RepID=A0A2P7TXM7_9NEIS|nr:sulfur carrier protein ThiS [Neisseria iguanae]PSJ79445.1 thiamine biosynthesis protein ThiS [Neisseria iguanae]